MRAMRALGLFCVVAMAAPAWAQVKLPFEGVITDANGQAVSGTVALRFALYAQAEGGAPLFEERHTVQVLLSPAITP